MINIKFIKNILLILLLLLGFSFVIDLSMNYTDDKLEELIENMGDSQSTDQNVEEELKVYTVNVTSYNTASTSSINGETVVLHSKDKTGISNYTWYRVLLKYNEETDLYDIVYFTNAGERYDDSLEFDYILAIHANCTDTDAYTLFQELYAISNINDYIVSLEIPSTPSDDVKVEVLIAENQEALTQYNSKVE